MAQTKVDPKLAQDIEEDMAEIDGKTADKPKTSKSNVGSQPCPDCASSMIGPGLLDAHTICPTCKGTGKVAVLN